MDKGIVPLDFKKRSSSDTIKSLIPTIDYYRSKGKTLLDIYAALSEKDLLATRGSSNMAFGTFRNIYYQQRKGVTATNVTKESFVKKPAVSRSSANRKRTQELPNPTAYRNDCDGDSPQADSSFENEGDSAVTETGFKRLELGGTLEEQFEIGSMYFRQ